MHPVLRARADQRHGLFTTAEAVLAGYTHPEIRNLVGAGRWVRLRRGVLVTADDLESGRRDGHGYRVDCLAVLLALDRPNAVISHASAARLWAFPRPRDVDDTIRLTDPERWRSGGGFRMTRAPLRPGEVWRAGAVRITSAARTLVDCAREWPLEDAVVAMDAALLAERTTTEDLRVAAAAVHHWPGAARAMRAAGSTDERAESPLETRGRLRMVGAGLTPDALQVEIHSGGRLVGVVDAWFEESAVAVEFDGYVKYADPWRGRTPEQVVWDEKRREDALRSLDIRVVRVADADLGGSWGRTEARLRALVATPDPPLRRFTAVPRTRGRRRSG